MLERLRARGGTGRLCPAVSWSPGWGCAGDLPLPERVVPLAAKAGAKELLERVQRRAARMRMGLEHLS